MVLGVLQGTVIEPDEICGFVLGDSCAVPFDPLEMWNITMSDKPKPPVKPHVRPKVRSAESVIVIFLITIIVIIIFISVGILTAMLSYQHCHYP